MTVAYFDCFSGIAGDMALGALVDAGAELAVVEAAVEALGLSSEVRVQARHEQRGHLGGTRVVVEVEQRSPRTVPALRDSVVRAELPPRVRELALAAIDRLAAAESRVHGVPAAELHLHELGGQDTLVDVVGSFWLMESLGVTSVHASPLPAPRGWLSAELPLPGPAVMRVLAGTGAIFEPDTRDFELVTPTGAAILAAGAVFERPALRVDRVGYGIGSRDAPGNALAVWIGEPVAETAAVTLLETHLDDMPPNQLAALSEDLMQAGALDVATTPIVMKKGRAGHRVTVMSEPGLAQRLSALILERSTALGLRVTRADRVLAGRRVIIVATPFGDVRVKVKELGGAAVDVAAESDDVLAAARAHRADPRRVARAAEQAGRRQLEIE